MLWEWWIKWPELIEFMVNVTIITLYVQYTVLYKYGYFVGECQISI